MKHSVMSVKVWDALKYTIADYSSRRALRLEQGNGLKCTESYSQNREGAVQSLKCTFKWSQVEPMQRNANQCRKREERCWAGCNCREHERGSSGAVKGASGFTFTQSLSSIQGQWSTSWLWSTRLWGFQTEKPSARLLVRWRSDQVRAMTNTMQSQYLAKTFNLKVLYLNSLRGW